jgi:hypothetical protein
MNHLGLSRQPDGGNMKGVKRMKDMEAARFMSVEGSVADA